MEEIRSCIICGSLLMHSSDTKDYFNTGEAFSLYACKECELLHTTPSPNVDEISRYYESDKYLSHNTDSKSSLSFVYKFIRRIALKNKLRLINRYSHSKKILDYGCGTGDFLLSCKKNGWNTEGLEPNEQARFSAAGKLQHDIWESESQLNEGYPVITLWHVLEHLHNPPATIRLLKDKLTPDGTLIVAVPNFQSPDARHYKEYWAGYDVPRHLFHFSKKSITRLTSKSGMKIVEIIPMKFDAYYVSLLSEKYIQPGEFPYLRAIRQGWKSNKKAAPTTNYSSLIYVIKAAS